MEIAEASGLADKGSNPHVVPVAKQNGSRSQRALALEPELMLFDEPTSSLDPEIGSRSLGGHARAAQNGRTMIVVTHEMPFAESVRIAFVVHGRRRIIEGGRRPSPARTQERAGCRVSCARLMSETTRHHNDDRVRRSS